MRRAVLLFLLGIVAPAAGAWVPCEQRGIDPPQPIQREAPAYPQAVRASVEALRAAYDFSNLQDFLDI